jgi:hypothetical protein
VALNISCNFGTKALQICSGAINSRHVGPMNNRVQNLKKKGQENSLSLSVCLSDVMLSKLRAENIS